MRRKNPYRIRRTNMIGVMLSEEELDALETYMRRYKVKTRAAVIREALMRFVVGRFVEDYPTLFEENEMKQLEDRDNY